MVEIQNRISFYQIMILFLTAVISLSLGERAIYLDNVRVLKTRNHGQNHSKWFSGVLVNSELN